MPLESHSTLACGIDDTTRPTLPPREGSTNPITIFPLPRRFAVVQMDPVAMLTTAGLGRSGGPCSGECFGAEEVPCVLLSRPGSPYASERVVSLLRQPGHYHAPRRVPRMGCHPRHGPPHPAEHRPSQRPQRVRGLQGPPPFRNCYFWLDSDTVLRVRVRWGEAGYDDRKATSLALPPASRLPGAFKQHIVPMIDGLGATRPPTAASDGIPSVPPIPQLDSREGRLPRLLDARDGPDTAPASTVRDNEPLSTSEPEPRSSMQSEVEDLFSMDLFGWLPDPTKKYIPLANSWFELEEHLSEGTIPSPVELWTEQQRIGAIINAAIERRNTAIERRDAVHAAGAGEPSASSLSKLGSLEQRASHGSNSGSEPLSWKQRWRGYSG